MQDSPRPLAAGFVIVVFGLFILITGATDRIADFFNRRARWDSRAVPSSRLHIELHPTADFPDFSNYIFLRTLDADEFPIRMLHSFLFLFLYKSI